MGFQRRMRVEVLAPVTFVLKHGQRQRHADEMKNASKVIMDVVQKQESDPPGTITVSLPSDSFQWENTLLRLSLRCSPSKQTVCLQRRATFYPVFTKML